MDICFPEETKIINVGVPVDISTSGLTTEWISMKNAKKATFFLSAGTIGSTSVLVVTLNVAASASGTTAATAYSLMDLPFDHYWISNADAGSTSASSLSSNADMYTKTSTSSNSTFTIAKSLDSRMFVIEVEAEKMGQFQKSSVDYDADYVRLAVANPGASALFSCVCILTGIRYKDEAPPTALL